MSNPVSFPQFLAQGVEDPKGLQHLEKKPSLTNKVKQVFATAILAVGAATLAHFLGGSLYTSLAVGGVTEVFGMVGVASVNSYAPPRYGRSRFTYATKKTSAGDKLLKQTKFAIAEGRKNPERSKFKKFKLKDKYNVQHPNYFIKEEKGKDVGTAHTQGRRKNDEDASLSTTINVKEMKGELDGIFDGHGDKGKVANLIRQELRERLSRLRELDDQFGPQLKTLYSTPVAIEEAVLSSDLVVGAVLIPGKKAPKLITEAMIEEMSPGSVFVDVAIDQGGCSETSRPTTHSDPTYIVHDVVHYCVANMPGACARTSTQALAHAIAPYVVELAQKGYKKALSEDKGFRAGLNVCLGHVTNEAVAEDCGYEYHPPEKFL